MYDEISFVRDDGSFNQVVNNVYIEDSLKKLGFVKENKYQRLAEGIEIFPEIIHCYKLMKGTKILQRVLMLFTGIHYLGLLRKHMF